MLEEEASSTFLSGCENPPAPPPGEPGPASSSSMVPLHPLSRGLPMTFPYPFDMETRACMTLLLLRPLAWTTSALSQPVRRCQGSRGSLPGQLFLLRLSKPMSVPSLSQCGRPSRKDFYPQHAHATCVCSHLHPGG